MAAPQSTIYQMQYQNPHATGKLILPVLVLCNTPDDELKRNIKINSAAAHKWLRFEKEHSRVAVMCGGGPSLRDDIDEIIRLKEEGAIIFAMNATSQFLRDFGITADYQVIGDAKPETVPLVDPLAHEHLFASQVDPGCFEAAPDARLWHLELTGIEDEFPPERRAKGGYALVGGGAAVGNLALCVAYVMGYRDMHLFGYDSSHRDGESHAYSQPMNQFIPNVEMEWAGRKFTASIAMKAQAERFQITGRDLMKLGVKLHVHGDGLLPTMWNTPATNMAEKDKYRLIWQLDSYRDVSPGEQIVSTFVDVAKPHGLILDLGCGTGRASVELAKQGYNVMLVDFADNCRDDEALTLPFLEWDLTKPCPVSGNYGLCTDMMEHIPPDDVVKVIKNIMASASTVFFQISTVPDMWGQLIGTPLHLSINSHEWWRATFEFLGFTVAWERNDNNASLFLVITEK